MKYRKLRIAWSVAWGVVAVLLCVLWIRSYFKTNYVSYVNQAGMRTAVLSKVGTIAVSYVDQPKLYGSAHPYVKLPGWTFDSSERDAFETSPDLFEWTDLFVKLAVPYWFLVLLCAVIGGSPWINWSIRFSLRTLLIATTLVAVVLGLIVWMSRVE